MLGPRFHGLTSLMPKIAGLFSLVLGATVIFGWLIHNTFLIQISPSFAPMQVNTALGFILSGAGLLALAFGWHRWAQAIGVALTFMATIILARYLTGLSFGIDQLFFEAPALPEATHPGWMAPNTALCFSIIGVVLVTHQLSMTSRFGKFLVRILASFLLVLSGSALLGYILSIESAYGWAEFTRMAAHTSAGFFTIGLGMLFGLTKDSGTDEDKENNEIAYWCGSVVAAVFFALTISFWWQIQSDGNRLLQRELDERVLRISRVLETDMRGSVQAIERIAGRWQARGGTPYPEWRSDAENYLRDISLLKMLGWIDSNKTLRWKVFADGVAKLPEIDLIFKDSQNFMTSNDEAAFATFSENIAKLGLQVVYVPIKVKGQSGGYITGVFDLTALPKFFTDSRVFDDDNVAVFSGGTRLFERALEVGASADEYEAVNSLVILDRAFDVKIWPTKAFLSRQRSNVPFYVLIAGSLFSLLTAALSYIGGVSALRARRLYESEIRHCAVVESAVDGLITVDDRGIIQTFNPACERLFGYKASEAIGNSASALVPDSHLIWPNNILKNSHASLQRSLSYIGRETKGTRKNGTFFPIELTISKINLSGKILYSGTIRDITERKEVERVKNEFISVVSHELRTPLTSIRGSLGLIVASLSDDLPDKVKGLITIAHKNCERLILIVNDILDIEKITSGEMQFNLKRESVAALTRQAVEANVAYAQKFNTSFEIGNIDEEISIEVDCDRFIQVLSNLLSNAAKFSPENEIIKISAAVSNGRARILVRDRGPGIPQEFHERIFDKFSQIDSSSSRAKGGTGLGLHITKKLVEKMGGSIGFDTQVGVGTTFWVEFPTPYIKWGFTTFHRQNGFTEEGSGSGEDRQPAKPKLLHRHGARLDILENQQGEPHDA